MFKIIVMFLLFIQYLWEQFLMYINIKFIEEKISSLPKSLPAVLQTIITPDDYTKAATYLKAKTRFEYITSSFNMILVILVIGFSLLKPIDELLSDLPIYRVLFCLIILVILQLIAIPFKAYSTFGIEKKFGFNKSTPKIFCMDILKGFILTILISLPLLGLLFWFYDFMGYYWWILGFFLFTGFQLLMLLVYPIIIAPIFNKFTPLSEGDLLNGIKDLAERINFPLKGVFLMDGSKRSSHSNAYFTGIGRSKRIVLFDTLIEKLSTQELLSVLAHELGHFKLHHVKIHLFVSTIFSFFTFYILSILLKSTYFFNALGYEKPSIHIGLILLGMILPIIEIFFSPLYNFMSRKHEYAADGFAKVSLPEGRKHLSNALVKLNKDNLATPQSHPLYSFIHYSHPPLAERLERLEK